MAVILAGVGGALWFWPDRASTAQPRSEITAASMGSGRSTGSIAPASIAPGSIAPGSIPRGSIPLTSIRSTPTRAAGSTARRNLGAPASRQTLETVGRSAGRPSAVSPRARPPAVRITVTSRSAPPAPPVLVSTSDPAVGPAGDPGQNPQAAQAVPATITIPFPSSNHPDGTRITVMPHGPAGNGEMWIPGPEEGIDNWSNAVSWLNSDGFAAPFGTHGAVIVAGHINWQGTPGALSDLSEYGRDDIGKILSVTMTDGRIRTYRIVRGLTIDKAQLAAESNQGPLHTTMFGQIQTYGPPGHPTEELRLISCGGQFDAAAGSYKSNVIIFARPVL